MNMAHLKMSVDALHPSLTVQVAHLTQLYKEVCTQILLLQQLELNSCFSTLTYGTYFYSHSKAYNQNDLVRD